VDIDNIGRGDQPQEGVVNQAFTVVGHYPDKWALVDLLGSPILKQVPLVVAALDTYDGNNLSKSVQVLARFKDGVDPLPKMTATDWAAALFSTDLDYHTDGDQHSWERRRFELFYYARLRSSRFQALAFKKASIWPRNG
jgi:hypothetical protein